MLRTNITLDPLAVMLRYRELLTVEEVFRTAKSLLATRPIYHQGQFASANLRPTRMTRQSTLAFSRRRQAVRALASVSPTRRER